MARLGAARVLHLARPGAYARCACGCFAAKFSYSVAEFSLFSRSVARRVRATRMLQAHVLLIVKQMIR